MAESEYTSQFTGPEIDQRLAKVPQLETALDGKQATLVSGENIATINNQSLLEGGNITVGGGGGDITVDSSLSSTSTNPVQNKVITTALDGKQETLVGSGTGQNIKTINNQNILGSGNIEIQGGGSLTVDSSLSTTSTNPVQNKVITSALDGKQDTISDLATIRSGAAAGATAVQPSALSAKQDVLVSGTNIKTINNESILGSGNITIQGGGGSDPNAVKYTEQTPTDLQKAQARENIGACSAIAATGSAEPSVDSSVKYTVQSLTNAQKTQARTNIGAGTSNFSGSYNDLQDKPQQVTLSQNILADKSTTGKAYSCKATYDDVHPAMVYAQPSGGMLPNVFYDLGVLDGGSITFSLAAPLDASVLNHYFFVFRTGETVPNVTWPSNIVGWINGGDPELEPMTHYEISIINGYAAFLYI